MKKAEGGTFFSLLLTKRGIRKKGGLFGGDGVEVWKTSIKNPRNVSWVEVHGRDAAVAPVLGGGGVSELHWGTEG